ncbi:SMP-30/gluconolactonase/LRE family protein [Cecembia rubra]|uniref:Sugar lactone lactonase YvrE n=1 Tax=Cecembia rubra TaxID=1485585 RepID=A0A2P8ECX4_9BACT|nr:SMP-30/gluconolactonase/LRE family protein [Cecembia rubra]PSL07277.1 sugar lactone lactonase YvrE [Cecembia rubra]
MCRLLLSLFLIIFIGSCKNRAKDQQTTDLGYSESEELYIAKPFTQNSQFTNGIEGPAVDSNGILYVVNFENEGTIGQVNQGGVASLFIDLPEGSTGNGIRFDSKGNMLIADYTGHNILKVNMESKAISVHAHNGQMNQPNDIAIMDNDILFASDPDWKNSTGQLWRIDADGSTHLLEKNMGTTNGVEVSPDNRKLYVNESVQRKVWVYDLSEKGDISNKRLLIQFDDFGMDGMRSDINGNLYITRHGKGTVVKVSPEGEILLEIAVSGKKPSNIAFGGNDGKTAFVTLQDNGNIDYFRIDAPGREF